MDNLPGLFPPYKAPPHTPRNPLQDVLYHVIADYRAGKAIGMKSPEHRRKALRIIAQIKGRLQ